MNLETMRLLVEKGLSAADILEIAETMDAPKVRSAAAERQARYRAREKAKGYVDSVTRDVTRDGNSDVTKDPLSLPPNEKISNPPTHTPENNTHARKGPIFVCPNGVDPAVWADFLKARKTKGCTNSATAYAKVLRDIAAVSATTGEPPGRVVEVAAERGWASINDWTEGKPHNGTANRKSPASRDRRDGFAKALDEWIDSGGDPFTASHSDSRPNAGFEGNGECGTARVIALRPDSVRTDFADDASGSAHAVYR